MFTNNDSSTLPTNSLFPAYSESNLVKEKDESKDWLCNSSFNPTDYQEVVHVLASQDAKQVELNNKFEVSLGHDDKGNKDYVNKTGEIAESDSIRSILKKKTFIEETGLSFERAYHFDPTPDYENLQFECFERKNIAIYKLKCELPFGLSLKEHKLLLQTKVKKIEKISRYFGKKSVKNLKNKSSINDYKLNQNLSIDNFSVDKLLEFIPLSYSNNKTISSDISSKFAKVSDAVDFNISEGNNEQCLTDVIQSKIISFNRELAESPNDIEKWLEFVEFQDETYKSELYFGNKNESFLIEKKIAILDKALEKNPASLKLNLAKLKLCKDILSREKLISLWENLIFMYPNSAEMWKEYLYFILTDIEYFNVPQLLKLYARCIQKLSNINEGVIKSHEALPNTLPNMICIFSHLCFVLKSCGYIELAIANFQALIEFNLFSPPSLNSESVSQQIECFEPFWDSGAARIGEDNALGWSSTISRNKIVNDKIVSESDLNSFEDDILDKKLPKWQTWLEFERLREYHRWLPWKPNPNFDQTEDDVDDENRKISFAEISKFLFRITGEINLFLVFEQFMMLLDLNLHDLGCSSVNKSENFNSNFINYDNLSHMLSSNLLENHDFNPFAFQRHKWSKEKFHFINNIFFQVIEKFSLHYRRMLSLIWLQFYKDFVYNTKQDSEFKDNIQLAKKSSKSLLRKEENRNNLILWLEYIQIQCLVDTKFNAQKNFEILISSSSETLLEDEVLSKEIWYFVRHYVELISGIQKLQHLHIEYSSDHIVWILSHIGGRIKYVPFSKPEIMPTLILKTELNLDFSLTRFVISKQNSSECCSCIDPYSYSIIDFIKCFVYFRYFTQGLDKAISCLEYASTKLNDGYDSNKRNYIVEKLTVFQAQLINFHVLKSNVSLKPLRTFLYQSIQKYSYNYQLLYFLIKLKSASALIGPTRRFFTNLLKNQHHLRPITWLFILASEFLISHSILESISREERFPNLGNILASLGINWKIRSLYNQALASPYCDHIAIIYRSYIKFEMLCGEINRAKGIFYKALQKCAWSKELLMEGIQYFPGDLKEIIDYMSEKQIRVHTLLEEVELLMDHKNSES